jgi:hypothetical protein
VAPEFLLSTHFAKFNTPEEILNDVDIQFLFSPITSVFRDTQFPKSVSITGESDMAFSLIVEADAMTSTGAYARG